MLNDISINLFFAVVREKARGGRRKADGAIPKLRRFPVIKSFVWGKVKRKILRTTTRFRIT